jgi:DNA invertase Pin-like site-specific DNA recombinase
VSTAFRPFPLDNETGCRYLYDPIETPLAGKGTDMDIGYARTSTLDQEAGLDAQLMALSGCERVFREQVGATASRPELEAALSHLRKGDTLVVWRLDRLGRHRRTTLLAVVADLALTHIR